MQLERSEGVTPTTLQSIALAILVVERWSKYQGRTVRCTEAATDRGSSRLLIDPHCCATVTTSGVVSR